ncbi:RDD family protein [Carboxylicivirga sp. N1Y90]|uniref:RDD family protein n=1 Tax=Carboxylicivirga fragile TaxID=3417571 RepID=UPI003D3479EE|nr:hypothetical protein [Marinilabiliaceae bacterium N1Y90]
MFGLAYFLLRDSLPFNGGQSYGRRLFNIRVVQRQDNSKLLGKHEQSLMRHISLLIPFFNIVEIYYFFFKHERFGEVWSETTIISSQNYSPE